MSLYLGENCISAGGSSAFKNNNIGEIIQSTIPLTDAGLHLLDGSVISGSGAYSAFVTYVAGLVSNYPDLFETEANWQTSVTNYGVCGKFVYDSVNNTVRLPKITGFTEGTIDPTALGNLTQAGLPSHTHKIYGSGESGTGNAGLKNYISGTSNSYSPGYFDTSRTYAGDFLNNPNSIYGASDTVQPQSIKVLYYIIIATSTKTEIEVDIDEVMTDLNGKVDIADLAECSVIVETYRNGTSWYRVWSDGWCEQGGQIEESGINVVNISFLKAYTSIPTLLTSVNSTARTSYLDNGIDVYNLTTTGFTKQYTVNQGTGWSWQAAGYIR